jgi:hypothetical protein
LKRIFCVIICCFSLQICCICYCYAQQNTDSNTANTATNDSVLNALEIEQDDVNDYDQKKYRRLQQLLNEQVKSIPTYIEKKVDPNKWDTLINDKNFNYQPITIQKEKPKQVANNLGIFDGIKWKNFMIIALFVLVALAVVIIIYAFFGKQYFTKSDKKIEIINNNWEEVESFNEWEKAIHDAIANNDYRLATRILYLQTLQQLKETNWIDYRKEKLSSEYQQQLYGTQHYKAFQQCNRYFDYIWYGNYTLTPQGFNDVKAQFIQFQNNIT